MRVISLELAILGVGALQRSSKVAPVAGKNPGKASTSFVKNSVCSAAVRTEVKHSSHVSGGSVGGSVGGVTGGSGNVC